jgi:hypothetical protein
LVPFFTLLACDWPGNVPPIDLNTETRSFEKAELPLTLLAAPELASQLRSARRLRCLDSLPHEYVLYMHEDYLINDSVDAKAVTPSMRPSRLHDDRKRRHDGRRAVLGGERISGKV